MKKVTRNLAIIFGVIAADQLSKGYLIYLLTGRVPGMVDAWDLVSVPYLIRQVNAFLNIVFTWNPGASFSLLRGVGEYAPWAIALITATIVGFILHYLFRRACDPEQVPLALIAGGAIGNLIDRVRFGAVVDFIDGHVGGWHWPAFNVADTCIVLGVALFILKWYIERRKCARAM